jgi:hypothetical protein
LAKCFDYAEVPLSWLTNPAFGISILCKAIEELVYGSVATDLRGESLFVDFNWSSAIGTAWLSISLTTLCYPIC